MSAPLLRVRGLTKHFQIGRPSLLRRRGELLKAVDGIGFDLPRGRMLGLVGLKPTRGRNPLGPDAGEHWNGMVVEHVVTRSLRDCAALLDCTAGPDVAQAGA